MHRRRAGHRRDLRESLEDCRIGTAAPAPRERLSYAAVNYRPRLVGCVLFVLMLLSIYGIHLPGPHAVFVAIFLAWPHLAYWRARRSGGDRSSENLNLLIECVLGGALIAAFAFRVWPSVAVYSIGLINLSLSGGPRYALAGLPLSLVGLAVAWPIFRPDFHFESEPAATALSIAAILSYAAFIGTTAYRLRIRHRETRAALEAEESRSRELLLNVFPADVVPRLRAGENPIADQFADVTVVFVDMVEFTPLAERLGPKRTVLVLNELFRAFDQSALRLGVEKIETTGDGYLAVGGAPGILDDHAAAVAQFALETLDAARATLVSPNEQVQIRVGIHTGPVFAGVIGESRFHYKIFGETVNTASRIQSQSRPGHVLVSETTHKRIRDRYAFDEHGIIELKGHGPMRTYWLQARSLRPGSA